MKLGNPYILLLFIFRKNIVAERKILFLTLNKNNFVFQEVNLNLF